jgi:hypothetical protein
VTHPYHHAVDGRLDTYWEPEGALPDDAFVGLDLLRITQAPRLRFVCAAGSYHVEVSLDAEQWASLHKHEYKLSTVEISARQGIQIIVEGATLQPSLQAFRYIRLRGGRRPSKLWVAEMQVL